MIFYIILTAFDLAVFSSSHHKQNSISATMLSTHSPENIFEPKFSVKRIFGPSKIALVYFAKICIF